MIRELFRVFICFSTPKGTVIGGNDAILNELSLEELGKLFRRVNSVSIVGDQCEFRDIPVYGVQMLTSLSDRRSFFLLLGPDIQPESIPTESLVTFDSPEDPSP